MTILEKFKEKESTIGILKALEALNDEFENIEITEELENELLDFGNFFVDNYEDETYDERIAYFGEEDAMILRLYDLVMDKFSEEDMFYESCEKSLTTLNRTEQSELEKVYRNILYLPGIKKITCEYSDGSVFSCEVDVELTKEQELALKGIIAKAISSEAVIMIELIKKRIITAYYFRNSNGRTISKHGLKKLHKIDPITGTKQKVKGYTYIEGNKLLEELARGNI